MKTSVKRITALLLLFAACSALFLLPVYAGSPMRSKYYNTVSTTAGVISGVLNIHNGYTINGDGFTSAEIHTYVERRVLGVFWVKVDNGETDKTWVDTSTSKTYTKNYTLTLTQTGTYRVTAEYTFNGSSNSEGLTEQRTVTY